ncbi:MAG: hypothetical protein WA667_14570 [Candidatus Nitrosopolaris sp.]
MNILCRVIALKSSRSRIHAPCQSPRTLSNLWCRVTTAATSSTVVLRINAANGNETFSITSNTTGALADSTHTDTIARGALLDVAIKAGSTALIITVIAATYSINVPNTITRIDVQDSPQLSNPYLR